MSTSAQRGQQGWQQHHAPPQRSSGVVTEREYLQAQIDALAERMELQFAAGQRASDLAASRLEARLESMNEIRQQLSVQRVEFATNEKFDTWGAAMATRVEALLKQIDTVEETFRNSSQRESDALRERHDRDIKMVNDDIRSLRESRSAAGSRSATSREWLTVLIALAAIAGALLGHFIH